VCVCACVCVCTRATKMIREIEKLSAERHQLVAETHITRLIPKQHAHTDQFHRAAGI